MRISSTSFSVEQRNSLSPSFHPTAFKSSIERLRLGLLFTSLILALVLSGKMVVHAQIAQGGAPWKWGSSIDLSNIPQITTGELDLTVLNAEDAVTDQYKEAPWRFGVEREVNLGLDKAASVSMPGVRATFAAATQKL